MPKSPVPCRAKKGHAPSVKRPNHNRRQRQEYEEFVKSLPPERQRAHVNAVLAWLISPIR